MTVQPDNAAALDFLQRWRPDGPWLLTAISPDRKGIETKEFDKRSVKALEKFLLEHGGTRNIYFHVNSTTPKLRKKADRKDMVSLDWLHVDLDPWENESLEEARERARSVLGEKLPEGVPPPTCIVFSGGGYQAFWRLRTPFRIDNDLDRAEEAKRWNLQLEILFKADNCHNVDRIMRLPGTVNVPDAKKRKKGRRETLAKVERFDEERIYDLEQFTPAPAKQDVSTDGWGGGQTKVEISGEITRLESVDELDEWDVSNRVKIVMAQGSDPDQELKGNDQSRSAWLFYFCCALARKGVPDETIFAIITDPGWGIAESVVELKGNAEKYAIRQIQRAKENAIDPVLEEYNSRYAVIQIFGGQCQIAQEIFDPQMGRKVLTFRSYAAFEQGLRPRKVQIGTDDKGNPKYMPAAKWWFENPQRREYETVTFAPNKQTPGQYNLWKGFACEAQPGDCSLFMEHVRENVCQEDDRLFAYLLGWMARTVQFPGEQGHVAMVMRGGRGTGKSFFAGDTTWRPRPARTSSATSTRIFATWCCCSRTRRSTRTTRSTSRA